MIDLQRTLPHKANSHSVWTTEILVARWYTVCHRIFISFSGFHPRCNATYCINLEEIPRTTQNLRRNSQLRTSVHLCLAWSSSSDLPLTRPRNQKDNMSLYAFCLAGGSFMVIGAWESLISTVPPLTSSPSSSSSSSASPPLTFPQPPKNPHKNPFLSSITYAATALLSFCFIVNSLFSLHSALNAKDSIGFAFQLQIITVASLFLLYAVTGLLTNLTGSVQFPASIHNLIALFAFCQEFLHFYLQRKDPTGLENRYFDLMLVPVTICVFATILDCGFPSSKWSGLVRGIGMLLQGTWFVQMGFSFFTDLITHGCVLHERSSGNFTVRCKGHMEEHRSKAIATLQFNSHLAFLLVVVLGIYSVVARKYGFGEAYSNYTPINSELHPLDGRTRFTLDSDDDDDENVVERNRLKMKDVGGAAELGVNGFGAH